MDELVERHPPVVAGDEVVPHVESGRKRSAQLRVERIDFLGVGGAHRRRREVRCGAGHPERPRLDAAGRRPEGRRPLGGVGPGAVAGVGVPERPAGRGRRGRGARRLGDGGVTVDAADEGVPVLGGAVHGEVGLEGGEPGGRGGVAAPLDGPAPGGEVHRHHRAHGGGAVRQGFGAGRGHATGGRRQGPGPEWGQGARRRQGPAGRRPPSSRPGPAHAGRTGLEAMATTSVTPVGAADPAKTASPKANTPPVAPASR